MDDVRQGQRIAVVLPDLRPGGVERVRLLLIGEFIAMGYEVDLVVRQARGELLADVPDAVRVHDLGAARVRNFPRAFARYLRARRPDIVLAALWPLTALATVVTRLVHRRAMVVVSEHNVLSRNYAIGPRERALFGLTARTTYGMADRVIAVSGDIRRDVSAMGRFPIDRVALVHNPIRRHAEPLSSPVGLPGDWSEADVRLVALGSLKRVKGFDLLVRAVAILADEMAVRLAIVGEGPERPALEALIAECGLGNSVVLPGYAADPFPWLAAADRFVLSSLSEGFPNVVTEALSVGTAVVATRCSSGPVEILEDGRHGVLVAPGDAAALAEGIRASLRRDWDGDTLRARAAAFDVETIARAYVRAEDFAANVAMNRPRVGVVVPLFDKSATIAACIASIQGQTVAVDQIVIVDDRSRDDSFEKATALAALDPRILVFRQPHNGGAAHARNTGAQMVTGEWLAFLDADDAWEPEFLDRMLRAAAETGADFGGCGRVQIDRGRTTDFLLDGAQPDAAIVLDGDFWTAFPGYYPLNSSCNVMKRQLFLDAGGFPETMRQREDHALWARLWGRGRCFFVNTPLSRIDKAADGLSRRPPRGRDLLAMILVLAGVLLRAWRAGRPGASALSRYLARTAPRFARSYAAHTLRRLRR